MCFGEVISALQFYRRGIYRCNNKYREEVRCINPGILSERIRHAPVTAVNVRVADKNELIANNHPVAETLCDCTEFGQEQAALVEERTEIERPADRLISENSRTAIDQKEYNKSYNSLLDDTRTPGQSTAGRADD